MVKNSRTPLDHKIHRVYIALYMTWDFLNFHFDLHVAFCYHNK